jgi:hypothetical protein
VLSIASKYDCSENSRDEIAIVKVGAQLNENTFGQSADPPDTFWSFKHVLRTERISHRPHDLRCDALLSLGSAPR